MNLRCSVDEKNKIVYAIFNRCGTRAFDQVIDNANGLVNPVADGSLDDGAVYHKWVEETLVGGNYKLIWVIRDPFLRFNSWFSNFYDSSVSNVQVESPLKYLHTLSHTKNPEGWFRLFNAVKDFDVHTQCMHGYMLFIQAEWGLESMEQQFLNMDDLHMHFGYKKYENTTQVHPWCLKHKSMIQQAYEFSYDLFENLPQGKMLYNNNTISRTILAKTEKLF